MIARKHVAIACAVACQSLLNILEAGDSSCESEEEIHQTVTFEQFRNRLRGYPNLVIRNVNFLEVTVPRYSDKQFREHFRMTRAIFSSLEERLGPALSRRECGRPRTPVCKARSWQSCGYWLLQNPFGKLKGYIF